MKLQDALYNWLQMKIVADARPNDHAAAETRDFFAQILSEDHQMTFFDVMKMDDQFITMEYEVDGTKHSMKFLRESAEQLLSDIEANPKYN